MRRGHNRQSIVLVLLTSASMTAAERHFRNAVEEQERVLRAVDDGVTASAITGGERPAWSANEGARYPIS
jgi:hypothetical protein